MKQIMQKAAQTKLFVEIKNFYIKYERLIMPAFLVLGFVLDAITFKAIDINTTFLLLSVHAVIVGFCIVYLRFRAERWQEKEGRVLNYGDIVAPVLMQFSLGALLSMVMIFYTFAGAVGVSWPFLAMLGFLALSNEIFKEYYLKPLVQFVVYFFVLSALFSLILPFRFHSISAWLFIAAGLLGLLVIFGFTWLLGKSLPHVRALQKRTLKYSGGILVIVFLFYFLNIIPPVPLSLRESSVYHRVARVGNDYEVDRERQSIFNFLVPGYTVHAAPGQKIYVFSAIFAPSELYTDVIHHWQWKNPETGEWQSMSKAAYSLLGGRTDGYRGYSFISINIPEGKWRVDLETPRGQVIGRIKFRVVHVAKPWEIETFVK